MKEFTINSTQIKKELYIFFGIFIFGNLVNVFAIVTYDGFWSELFSQLHIVLALTAIVYLIVAFIRVLVYTVGQMVTKLQKFSLSKK